MPIIVVREGKRIVIELGGEAEKIVRRRGGDGGAEGGVIVVDGNTGSGNEVGDVFVAVVEVVGDFTP